MYLFTLAVTCSLLFAVAVSREKCCDFGERLTFENSQYRCVRDVTKRLGIIASSANFFLNNTDGECVDAVGTTHFVSIKTEHGNIVTAETTGDEYFPKCCPLGYVYNSQHHSCEKRINAKHGFITASFVKVGLPHCKVIVDYKLKKLTNVGPSSQFCVDEDLNGDFIKKECKMDTKICNTIRCINKCCPDGQSFVNGANCEDTYTNGLNLSSSGNVEDPMGSFAVVSNRTCAKIFRMNPDRYIFSLEKDGTFKYWYNYSNAFVLEQIDAPLPYCMEHVSMKSMNGLFFFKCLLGPKNVDKFKYTLWPKVLSCVFFAITVAVYLVLNETRKLFGKILINYCVAMMCLYSILVYTQIDLQPTDTFCKLAGYALIFFSVVSFAWMNILCCDIWFTFGTTKIAMVTTQRKKEDFKRLMLYMLCGWGIPIILTLTIYLFTLRPILPDSIHPYIGYSMCFIEGRNYAPMLFVRLPLMLIEMVNIVLFFKTIIYCLKTKAAINKINDTTKSEKKKKFQKDKEGLALILKLSIIMGNTFLFETISGFMKMSEMGTIAKYTEIVWDCINCLQGVFVFIIFICKRKIYNEFKKKLRKSPPKRFGAFTRSSATSSTRLSMTTSRNSRNNDLQFKPV